MNKHATRLARLICSATLATGSLALANPEPEAGAKTRTFQPSQKTFTKRLDGANRESLRQSLQSPRNQKALAGMRLATEDDTVRGVALQETFLSYNGFCTFIPKGAILNLPKKFEARTSDTPEGSLIPFNEFLRKNPAWVMTFEMSLDMVKGEEQMPSAKIKFIQSSGRIVVSTHQKNPVAQQSS